MSLKLNMGLLGLLGFALQCFDVLAWPLFALLYPLYSSIRAIETNSISDTHKLNTYWIVFSLILLFEHAFMKLLECFSLWPYMRLLIVFYLVIPHFDGALYVYRHLICPCLSMDPQILFSLFKMRKESLVRENFLSEVERYVKENGYEGLEKFISSKPNGGQNDMKAVQVLVKKKETTANQVSEAEPILTVNKDRSSAMQIKEKTIEVAADRRILETPPSKKVQKELTAVSALATQTDAKNIEVAADTGILKTLPQKKVQKEWTAISPLPTQTDAKTIEVAADRGILKTLPQKKVQKEWTAISPLPTQTDAKTIEVAAERGILKTPPPKKVQGELAAVCPLPIQTDAKNIEVAADTGILKTLPQKKVQKEWTAISPLPTQTDAKTIEKVQKEWTAISPLPTRTDAKTIEVAAERGILKTPPPKKVQGELTAVCPLPIQTDATFDFPLGGNIHKATYEAVKINNEAKPNLTLTEDHTVPAVKINGKPVEVGIGMEHPQSPKQVQKEWTCALCQVTTTCETTLNSHLQGRKHTASYDALKARNQAFVFVPTNAPASTAKTSHHPNKEPGKSIPSSGVKQKVTSNEHVQAQKKISPITKLYKPKEVLVDGVSSNGLKGKTTIHLEKVQSQQPKQNSRLWCAVCSVRCSGEIDMMCHLKGRKHKENEQRQENLRQENLFKVAGMNKPWGICDTVTGVASVLKANSTE
ncbi:hypothetical protein ACLB2K_011576 [Fragaria x ananassa]